MPYDGSVRLTSICAPTPTFGPELRDQRRSRAAAARRRRRRRRPPGSGRRASRARARPTACSSGCAQPTSPTSAQSVSCSCFFASMPKPFATPCGARGFGAGDHHRRELLGRDLRLGEDRLHRAPRAGVRSRAWCRSRGSSCAYACSSVRKLPRNSSLRLTRLDDLGEHVLACRSTTAAPPSPLDLLVHRVGLARAAVGGARPARGRAPAFTWSSAASSAAGRGAQRVGDVGGAHVLAAVEHRGDRRRHLLLAVRRRRGREQHAVEVARLARRDSSAAPRRPRASGCPRRGSRPPSRRPSSSRPTPRRSARAAGEPWGRTHRARRYRWCSCRRKMEPKRWRTGVPGRAGLRTRPGITTLKARESTTRRGAPAVHDAGRSARRSPPQQQVGVVAAGSGRPGPPARPARPGRRRRLPAGVRAPTARRRCSAARARRVDGERRAREPERRIAPRDPAPARCARRGRCRRAARRTPARGRTGSRDPSAATTFQRTRPLLEHDGGVAAAHLDARERRGDRARSPAPAPPHPARRSQPARSPASCAGDQVRLPRLPAGFGGEHHEPEQDGRRPSRAPRGSRSRPSLRRRNSAHAISRLAPGTTTVASSRPGLRLAGAQEELLRARLLPLRPQRDQVLLADQPRDRGLHQLAVAQELDEAVGRDVDVADHDQARAALRDADRRQLARRGDDQRTARVALLVELRRAVLRAARSRASPSCRCRSRAAAARSAPRSSERALTTAARPSRARC